MHKRYVIKHIDKADACYPYRDNLVGAEGKRWNGVVGVHSSGSFTFLYDHPLFGPRVGFLSALVEEVKKSKEHTLALRAWKSKDKKAV